MRSAFESDMTTSFARRQQRSIVAPVTRRPNRAAELSRSTSDRRTRTRSTRKPDTSRARARATVLVSGSSGTARKFAPCDVGTELFAAEFDAPRRRETLSLGLLERVAAPGHGEHAAAARLEPAAGATTGPGVKHDDVRL